MGIEYLTSYNFNFDIGIGDRVGTIRKTHQQLTDKTFYLPIGKAFLKKIDYKDKQIILDLEIDFIEN